MGKQLPLFKDPDQLLELALLQTGTGKGNSFWTEYVRCPRAHRLRWKQGVEPIERDDALMIGSLLHSALAYMGLGAKYGVAVKWGRVLIAATERKLYPIKIISEVRRLLQIYFLNYSEKNGGYPLNAKVLEVEHYLEVKLGQQIYSARLDTLLSMRNMPLGYSANNTRTRIVVVDHKTASWKTDKSQSELADEQRAKPQFLGHAYLIREHFDGQIPLVMVNQIFKTKIPQFRRIFVDFDDYDIDRWAKEHKSREKQLGMDQDWMNYSQCVPGIGKPCWAFRWCHGTAEERAKYYRIVERKK